jgi:hypothetical protein
MTAHESLTVQLLQWISAAPHSYGEGLETWKSSCPRLTIWEDALGDGLIACDGGREGRLSVSERGKLLMGGAH